jgi:H+-transporting ATPase
MTPLGWRWAGFVWIYALAWALVNDRVKLLAYKIFDPIKAEPKSETKTDTTSKATAEAKPEARADAKPKVKAESKPEVTADAKPEAKTPSDLAPQIAKRAYELYEQRDRKDGRAVQDWKKAEQEIRKPDTKADPKLEAKAEPEPEAKDSSRSDLTPQLVKRVHELYEDLGRKEVKEVEEWEMAKRKTS